MHTRAILAGGKGSRAMPDREELRRKLREKRRQARGGGQPADPRAALERQVMELAGDDPAMLRMASGALRDPEAFAKQLGRVPAPPPEEEEEEGLPPNAEA